LKDHIASAGVSVSKGDESAVNSGLRIIKNKIHIDKNAPVNSYIAADIASFIRQKLIEAGVSFSFETVLSHPSKIDLLKQAKEHGYKIYLYYVATDSPIININRVSIRVAKKGHPVAEDIIEKRYYRSLEILLDVIKLSNRAYLFDNSGKYYELVAEITEGKKVSILDLDKVIPEWFMTYVYDKIKKP
jgi:predicted ABC-type ATPase